MQYAHHNADRTANKSVSGTEEFEIHRVPGKHEFLNIRTSPKTITQGGLIPPVLVYVNIPVKLLQGYAVLLCVPSKRAESRVMLVLVAIINALIPRLIFKFSPAWMRHMQSMNVLDGDNILLRGVQRELGDKASWKSKFLPLEKKTDRFVVSFRKWMDLYRDDMPWRSPDLPIESLPRSAMIDRFTSHVMHCKSCMGAYKAFQCAAFVSKVISNACFVALVCVAILAGTGNIAAHRVGTVKVMSVITALIFFCAAWVHRLSLKMNKEFTVTDTARKLFLAP